MTITGLRTLDHSLSVTQEWLKDVAEEMGLIDQQEAFVATRAVLHTLRDRLTVDEAAHFAAQLPILLQGVYYHDWTPRGKPVKMRSKEEFYAAVEEKLMSQYSPIEATRAVLNVIQSRMPCGQIDSIKNILPEELRDLWPA
ncbi:MAG: DUF2267 domain-containing protein [Planctomycetaceae bacterium]|nr:DUF2267 domain-containing protein [Planctomycetaceae bacterium]